MKRSSWPPGGRKGGEGSEEKNVQLRVEKTNRVHYHRKRKYDPQTENHREDLDVQDRQGQYDEGPIRGVKNAAQRLEAFRSPNCL